MIREKVLDSMHYHTSKSIVYVPIIMNVLCNLQIIVQPSPHHVVYHIVLQV